ncbi:DDB1- and CUL4-associated factor 8-like protein 1, partial [Reticulomyxa filosa]
YNILSRRTSEQIAIHSESCHKLDIISPTVFITCSEDGHIKLIDMVCYVSFFLFLPPFFFSFYYLQKKKKKKKKRRDPSTMNKTQDPEDINNSLVQVTEIDHAPPEPLQSGSTYVIQANSGDFKKTTLCCYTVTLNPLNNNIIAAGCRDQWVRFLFLFFFFSREAIQYNKKMLYIFVFGKRRDFFGLNGESVTSLAWSYDGRELVASYSQRDIALFDIYSSKACSAFHSSSPLEETKETDMDDNNLVQSSSRLQSNTLSKPAGTVSGYEEKEHHTMESHVVESTTDAGPVHSNIDLDEKKEESLLSAHNQVSQYGTIKTGSKKKKTQTILLHLTEYIQIHLFCVVDPDLNSPSNDLVGGGDEILHFDTDQTESEHEDNDESQSETENENETGKNMNDETLNNESERKEEEQSSVFTRTTNKLKMKAALTKDQTKNAFQHAKNLSQQISDQVKQKFAGAQPMRTALSELHRKIKGIKAVDEGVPIGFELKTYQGHRSVETIKECNFLGPRSEYVMSGSDCGHVFIWKKSDGTLGNPVNCSLVTSGLDHTVKFFIPTAESPNDMKERETVLNQNQERQGSSRNRLAATLLYLLMRRGLLEPEDSMGDEDHPTEYIDISDDNDT